MTTIDEYNDNVKVAFLMCLLSGLSTAIGGLYVIFVKSQSYKVLGHLLSFSSGVMIYISFMDLLPEAIAEIGFFNSNLWFFFGMIFFAVILKLVPHDHEEEEKDHTHTHTHNSQKEKDKITNEENNNNNNNTNNTNNNNNNTNNNNNNNKSNVLKNRKNNNNSNNNSNNNNNQNNNNKLSNTVNKKSKKDHYLNMVGIRTAIGVSLHNFPEGVAVYLSCLKGIDVGLPLMLAIAAHNIPEGMAVAAPIYSATNSKWKAFKYCLYSGLCEPIGAVIFGIVFNSFMTPYLIQSMLAAVAGIMVFMVLKELLPASLKYVSINESVFSNIIGMMFFFLSIHYLHEMLPHNHGDSGSHGHSHGGSHGHSHGSGSHGHSHGSGSHGHSHGSGAQGHNYERAQTSANFNAFE